MTPFSIFVVAYAIAVLAVAGCNIYLESKDGK